MQTLLHGKADANPGTEKEDANPEMEKDDANHSMGKEDEPLQAQAASSVTSAHFPTTTKAPLYHNFHHCHRDPTVSQR
jgi:hypothetical protein